MLLENRVTGGSFHVAMDSTHLQEIFQSLTIPPPTIAMSVANANASEEMFTDFVYLGFPTKTFQGHASFVLNQENVALASTSYTCPRCYTRSEIDAMAYVLAAYRSCFIDV
jgi:hypothetical protein